MIFSLGHGQKLQWAAADGRDAEAAGGAAGFGASQDPDVVPAARAVPDLELAAEDQDGAGGAAAFDGAAPESEEVFGYLFPDAAEIAAGERGEALNALAKLMEESGEDPAGGDDQGNADIAPVVTYMGQFIDHDITAGTNTEAVTEALRIGGPTLKPQNRSLVVAGLRNMRKGTLQLDSLYGDGPIDGPMSARLQAAMRDPGNPNRMRVGELSRLNGTDAPISRVAGEDNRLDLPRVGAIVGTEQFPTPDDLPEALRPESDDDARWDRRAFIGDSRNDENLILAQTHVAFLRLHNSFVDRGQDFEQARRSTVWHYQWLVINDYLPAIADAVTLANVLADTAPLYRRFLNARSTKLPAGSLPIPLEFSAAAFRFGHSMVRGEYDYNANFTRGGAGTVPGTFELMFAFTGNGEAPFGPSTEATLPDNWPIDWARFVDHAGPLNRRARRVDTRLTPPLFAMANESPDVASLFRRLAERNLRRGHVINLPSAQELIAKLKQHGWGPSVTLTPDEIASGPTAAAILDGGFADETPLWFYVLKEAELKGLGGRLGPLGTRIIAETLVGLVVSDAQSYWNATGGRWSPDDAATDGHAAITTMPELFRAAGVM